jgi:hypothetical protein
MQNPWRLGRCQYGKVFQIRFLTSTNFLRFFLTFDLFFLCGNLFSRISKKRKNCWHVGHWALKPCPIASVLTVPIRSPTRERRQLPGSASWEPSLSSYVPPVRSCRSPAAVPPARRRSSVQLPFSPGPIAIVSPLPLGRQSPPSAVVELTAPPLGESRATSSFLSSRRSPSLEPLPCCYPVAVQERITHWSPGRNTACRSPPC